MLEQMIPIQWKTVRMWSPKGSRNLKDIPKIQLHVFAFSIFHILGLAGTAEPFKLEGSERHFCGPGIGVMTI